MRWICCTCWKRTLEIFYLTYKSLEGASRIFIIYQIVLYHEDEDSEEYARTYYEALNQTLLTQKYQGLPPNTFYGMEAYGTQ